jgi:hypothetical protein
MLRSEAAEVVSVLFREVEFEWDEYGQPDVTELETAVAMMQDEVDRYDEPVSLSSPALGLRLDKNDEGEYNLYFFVGSIER